MPGGTFLMGSDDFYPEERPRHRVTVDGFWMDEPPGPGSTVAGRERDPVVHVAHADAAAHAAWAGR